MAVKRRRRQRRGRLPACAGSLLALSIVLAACGSGNSDLGSSSGQSSSSTTTVQATNAAAALINTGITQANAKQYQEAETTFRDVLVLSPSNKFAWYNLGLIAQMQNQATAALADYTKAIAIDPKYTPAMYNKAILLERTNPHAALALYQLITSINAKAATAYLRESFVYQRLGDKAKASEARGHAVALDSSLASVTSTTP
jgi:tetratricopeptide (TPR) repeat protein